VCNHHHHATAYNAADRRDKRWRDPSIYDAPLTERGVAQATALRGKLERLLAKQ
jgi:broad specificity phosphatase PhoE